jgi:hypothetical protein
MHFLRRRRKMRSKFTLLLAILLFATSMVGTTFAGKIIYVDADATGGNNGSSWADAYICLQDAFAAAQFSDQIWVAAGTYKPDCGPGITPGDRTATFQLKNGVTVKGGYAGSGEPDPNARNIEVSETILSGDLAGDDGPDFTNNAENSHHVVTAKTTSPAVTLDGFTITGGNANGTGPDDCGGGMYNSWSRPTLTNCTFTANWAHLGGAMYNDISSPNLTNCKFIRNSADSGAGMYNSSSILKLTDCTFTGNAAGEGGGMYNSSSTPALTNCAFTENSAGGSGGGMYNGGSGPTLTNCTFTENSAVGSGGGMCNGSSSPNLADCTFTGNSANSGGGMHNDTSSPNLTGCRFKENIAASNGGGMCTNAGSPKLTNCTFIQNWAVTTGGGMYNTGSSCWVCPGPSTPNLTNCIFTGNYAQNGGGMASDPWGYPTLVNCIFNENWAPTSGGGIYKSGPGMVMTNCTFAGNEAHEGSGMYGFSSTPTAANCILWDRGEEIGNVDSTITITYSNISGGWPGEGNINADPCFVDPDGPDGIPGTEDDNLRLHAGSLCIDAGDNNSVPAGITDDLDGSLRFVDDPNTLDKGNGTPPIVDMGAYEGAQGRIGVCGDSGHPYPKGDLNQDCLVDFADFAEFADNWLVCNAPKCD